MPRGGYRPNSGRKKKALSEKIAAGNPSKRALSKVEFDGIGGEDSRIPPDYLKVMVKNERTIRRKDDTEVTVPIPLPTPTELYLSTVKFLEPTECLQLISSSLIADYALAKYHLLISHLGYCQDKL